MSEGLRKNSVPTSSWGCLPEEMRLLCIGPAEATAWVDRAASSSSCRISCTSAASIAVGLQYLSVHSFDAVLLPHTPPALHALRSIEALRTAAGDALPLVILARREDTALEAPCFQAGGDDFIVNALDGDDPSCGPSLFWRIARASERAQLLQAHRRSAQDQEQRLSREHRETSDLLQQQRSLIAGLESLAQTPSEDHPPTAALAADYLDLLRTHVIMGSGKLQIDLQRLCRRLVQNGLGPADAMALHVQSLEKLVRGLGSRSARHVMNRGDLLILEIMMHLAECYRAPQAAA